MAKLSRAIAALLLCSGLLISAGVVRATQEKAAPDAAKPQRHSKPKAAPNKEEAPMAENTVNISGKVTSVTEANVTIVDDQKAEHTVVLTPDTKITKGGKEATVADVKADALVTIVARKGDGDALTAVQITVSEPSNL